MLYNLYTAVLISGLNLVAAILLRWKLNYICINVSLYSILIGQGPGPAEFHCFRLNICHAVGKDELDKTALKEQKAKAKQDAADLRENKRLARKLAAEEKAKKKEEKKGKGNDVSEPSMGSVNTGASDATSANDATDTPVAPEPKRKRLRRVQNPDPVPESGEHDDVPKLKTLPDPKQRKVDENYALLQSTGISDLQPELRDRKSFTVRPGDGVMDGARAIGVILTTASFYVNRTMLTTDDWPPSLRELYKVGGL